MVVVVTEEKRGDSETDATITQGKDELNLAMLPIAVASTQQPRRADGIKQYKRVINSQRWDTELQTFVPAIITFKTNSDDGLPTSVDEQFFVGLFHLLYEANQLDDDKVTFTPHRLFSLMKLKGRGEDYDRLGDALKRLQAVTIEYQNSWWDHNRKEYIVTLGLGIIANYKYTRPKDGELRSGKPIEAWVRFDKELLTQLRCGVIKNLNLDRYYSFKRPLAKRMYRVLDRHFYNDPLYEMDLRVFACGYLGLPDTYDNGKLKEKLRPAIKELEKAGIILSVPTKQRYRKIKAGIWRICFEQDRNPGAQEVLQELLDRGVSDGVARNFVAQYTANYIRPKVDLLDWKMRNRDPGVARNPAGYLVKAIREDYQPPKNFKNRHQLAAEDASKRKRVVAKQRQRHEEQAKADEFRREYNQLRDEHEKSWLALTDDERATYDLITAKHLGENKDKAVAYWKGLFRRKPDFMLYYRLRAFAEAKQQDSAAP